MDLPLFVFLCMLIALIIVAMWTYISYKKLYHVMIKFILIYICLSGGCSAQEPPPDATPTDEDHPVVFPNLLKEASQMAGMI